MLVRPYQPSVSQRVLALFRRCGLELDPIDRISPGTSDADVVAAVLRRSDTPLLVVPFHAHRNDGGMALDGLSVVVALWREVGSLKWPIVMPVSATGAAALTLALDPARTALRPPIEVMEALCTIELARLEDPSTIKRLGAYLSRRLVARKSERPE